MWEVWDSLLRLLLQTWIKPPPFHLVLLLLLVAVFFTQHQITEKLTQSIKKNLFLPEFVVTLFTLNVLPVVTSLENTADRCTCDMLLVDHVINGVSHLSCSGCTCGKNRCVIFRLSKHQQPHACLTRLTCGAGHRRGEWDVELRDERQLSGVLRLLPWPAWQPPVGGPSDLLLQRWEMQLL